MNTRRLCMVAGTLVVAATLLAACRAEEQGRITNYEPGVYKGRMDQSLNKDAKTALRNRIRLQSDAGQPGGGGGGIAPRRDVRKPVGSTIDLGNLNNRARNQRGP